MDELREQAGCVFLVSHSLDTIKDMCTRVIWLDKGDLIAIWDADFVHTERDAAAKRNKTQTAPPPQHTPHLSPDSPPCAAADPPPARTTSGR